MKASKFKPSTDLVIRHSSTLLSRSVKKIRISGPPKMGLATAFSWRLVQIIKILKTLGVHSRSIPWLLKQLEIEFRVDENLPHVVS